MNSNGIGFYVTLPSDSSKDLFPENNPSEYVNKLSRWIDLNGEWEVGLHSVAYTPWNIVKHLNEPILCTATSGGTTVKYEIILTKKYYTTVDEYVTDINESVKKLFKKERFDEKTRYIKFSILNGKVTVTSSHFTIYLRKEQAIVLGFMKFDDPEEVKKITRGTTTGSYNANLHRETNIHVYCDIVQAQIVGDTEVPLIGVIPTAGKTSGMHETVHEVENIHYIPIQTKSFQKIKVLLRSSTYEPIPFEYGRATITLHFKPVNYF